MLFEQDGYKTFGEKMLVVACCKFVTSQALTMGNIFMNDLKFWLYPQKCTFQSFVAFLRKDGTKRENLKVMKTKKTNKF